MAREIFRDGLVGFSILKRTSRDVTLPGTGDEKFKRTSRLMHDHGMQSATVCTTHSAPEPKLLTKLRASRHLVLARKELLKHRAHLDP
jgi:hypothetical protein